MASDDAKPSIADWLNISHELRTPANAILGYVELLLSGCLGPLSAEARASLGDVQKAGVDLLGQLQQAIELAECLSPLALDDTNALNQLLNETWRQHVRSSDEMSEMPPSERRQVELSDGPTAWLSILAILLHRIGVNGPNLDQTSATDDHRTVGIDKQSCSAELRLRCSKSRHADDTIYLAMIEAALKATGGRLRWSKADELVLAW